MLLTLSLSLIIGLLLGVLGGGGSILTVPMLVYLLGLEPKKAIVTAFVVVGVSSLLALIPHARRGAVCWKSGAFFGLTGMVGAFAGGKLAAQFSGEVLMSLFGLICLLTGILMLRSKRRGAAAEATEQPKQACPVAIPYLRLLFDGFFVGGLTGVVGVGGGFLIVPALSLLVGIPMQGAIGTSLLVIAMNAFAGLLGYSQHVQLELTLTALVASGTLVGSAIGAGLSGYINPGWLRRGFGLMVVMVAAYILSQSINVALLSSLHEWLDNPQQLEMSLVWLLLFWLLLRISRWIHQPNIKFLPHIKAGTE